jgi:hypothetical protein
MVMLAAQAAPDVPAGTGHPDGRAFPFRHKSGN